MIDGQEVAINTDFRDCLRIVLAFEDNDLAAIEKQSVLIDNLYPERPNNLAEAVSQGVKFLNGGDGGEEKESLPRLYSFSKDAGLIFAAFRQTHGIDLETASMHWWKFQALFMDLGQDTAFCNLVGLRKRVKTGKASKEERAAAREMGEAFDVPEVDDRTIEERDKADEFMRLLAGGK